VAGFSVIRHLLMLTTLLMLTSDTRMTFHQVSLLVKNKYCCITKDFSNTASIHGG